MDKLHGGNETENTSNMTSTDNVRTEVDTLMHIFCPRTGSGVPCLDPWRRGCAVFFFPIWHTLQDSVLVIVDTLPLFRQINISKP